MGSFLGMGHSECEASNPRGAGRIVYVPTSHHCDKETSMGLVCIAQVAEIYLIVGAAWESRQHLKILAIPPHECVFVAMMTRLYGFAGQE